jgi:hypothetical protein
VIRLLDSLCVHFPSIVYSDRTSEGMPLLPSTTVPYF